MHRLELTDAQTQILLHQVQHTRDAEVLRRALALLELDRGKTMFEVVSLLRISLRTLYRWVEDFQIRIERAAAGPGDESSGESLAGRPRIWEEDLDAELEALLSYSPQQLGYGRTQWTAPLLRSHFIRWLGEDISVSTLRRRLREMGLTWKRGRYVLKADPQKLRKMREIQTKIALLTPRHALLCLDETDLLLFPPLRRAWSPRGQRPQVEISGWNEKRVVFGAIHINSGHLLMMSRDRHQVADFQAFLRLISNAYRGWHPVLLMDEHPSHTASASQALVRTLGMEIWWLPKRSPDLNPLDTLWGKAKDSLLANYQYEDFDEQVDLFIRILTEIPPATVRTVSGLESGSHWLRNL